MHELADMLCLSRWEFERNLVGLNDEDARKRVEPMNCISWIIAHVADQHYAFFVAWPRGVEVDSRYLPYAYGSPPSRPPLEEAMELWKEAGNELQPWLEAADDETLRQRPPASRENENYGALLVRCIFHTWCHLGEISSIRQVLGHRPPQFVEMYGWNYSGR